MRHMPASMLLRALIGPTPTRILDLLTESVVISLISPFCPNKDQINARLNENATELYNIAFAPLNRFYGVFANRVASIVAPSENNSEESHRLDI